MQSDAGVSEDDEEIEVVEHFKYLGSLKSADVNCNKDTRCRIGMAKKRILDLVPIWKDRGNNKDLKMKLVRSLVWTVLTYGAEGWTLTTADEKRIHSAELWIYRRILRVSWTEHKTDESILIELCTTRQLLGFVVRRKLSFFGHTIRDGGCELVKCVIQGKVIGKRRRGRPKTSYSSNITKRTSVSTERITRETRDHAGWRRLIRCAARRLIITPNGTVKEEVYGKKPAILGVDTCERLGLVKRVCIVDGDTAEVDYSELFNEHNDVFQGFGCLEGKYSINVDENVAPNSIPSKKGTICSRR